MYKRRPKIYDTDAQDLFRALSEYNRARRKYSEAKPNPTTSCVIFDQRFSDLKCMLEKDEISDRINQVLNIGDNDQGWTIKSFLRGVQPRDRDFEIALSKMYGIRESTALNITDPKKYEDVIAAKVSDSESLIEILEIVHEFAKENIRLSRGLSNRGEKKVRKRDIGSAVTSVIFGTGTALANSYFGGIIMVSCGVSLSAFHQATRDIVGTPDHS